MKQYIKASRVGTVCQVAPVSAEEVDTLALYYFRDFYTRLRTKDLRDCEVIYTSIDSAVQVRKLQTL